VIEQDRPGKTGGALGPWPDMATAFAFLRFLTGRAPAPQAALEQIDPRALAGWLATEGLAALAYRRAAGSLPALAAQLQTAAFRAAAETGVILSIVDEIDVAAPPELRLVALKGAALALSAYPDPALRSMLDLDLWLPAGQMEVAQALLAGLGFADVDKATRPRALQAMARGEVRFHHRRWVQGIVELHWSPLKGWWYSRAAAVDEPGIATRCLPLGRRLERLAAEDMAVHVAAHLAISDQFGVHVWRSLVDLALLPEVNWTVVAERARAWRLATAVWAVVALLVEVLDAGEARAAAERLRPGRLRRWALARYVSAAPLLAGRDWRQGRARFVLLLLLVDRRRDAARLIGRTLWPERAWLEARYGKPVRHAYHLWQVVRYGRV